MTIYYGFCFFVFGIIMGSFYNVVGYRLPKGESLLYPGSHCTNCNHKLSPLELIPIFSFLFLGGKCKKCKQKISWFYPIFEFASGLLFLIAFLVCGFNYELIIAITFISLILIIFISDYNYMIIPDEVLVFFSVALIIEIGLIYGLETLCYRVISAVIAFVVMLLIKLLGDFIFKKESMGGGDIKLLAVFGLVLGFETAILSIFLASFIGLPISLIIYLKNKNHELPFGPYLGISAIILLLTKFDFNQLIQLLQK